MKNKTLEELKIQLSTVDKKIEYQLDDIQDKKEFNERQLEFNNLSDERKKLEVEEMKELNFGLEKLRNEKKKIVSRIREEEMQMQADLDLEKMNSLGQEKVKNFHKTEYKLEKEEDNKQLFTFSNKGKVVSRVEVTNNADSDYSAETEALLFSQALVSGNMTQYRAYKDKYKDTFAIKYISDMSEQDTTATDLKGTAPGYHLESGDTHQYLGDTPLLYREIIWHSIYASSKMLYLTNGLTLSQKEVITLFDEILNGMDGTARGEEKPDLTPGGIEETKVSFKKYAGKLWFAEEAVLFDRFTQAIINNMSNLMAKSWYKTFDYDGINGAGGDDIIGLGNAVSFMQNGIRGAAASGADKLGFLEARVETVHDIKDISDTITYVSDPDVFDADQMARVVLSHEVAKRAWNIYSTTGGLDLITARKVNANTFNFNGQDVKTANYMFSNAVNNGIIGVINLGGLKAYTPNNASGLRIKVNPYEKGSRNMILYIGEVYVDLVVENSRDVVLLVDGFTYRPTAAATTPAGGASLTLNDLKKADGTVVPDGKKFTLHLADTDAIISSGTSSSGDVAFTISPAQAGKEVYAVDENKQVVALATLGA